MEDKKPNIGVLLSRVREKDMMLAFELTKALGNYADDMRIWTRVTRVIAFGVGCASGIGFTLLVQWIAR